MAAKTRKRGSSGSKPRFIGRPSGLLNERVQAVGPDRFGIVTVDCAKRRSKWMLSDFYGKVLVEPTFVEHSRGSLGLMTRLVALTCESAGLADIIVAVEMTGVYHRPVLRCFREAGFDTRLVHPYASKHFRESLHPGIKTDDCDLEAIFHAAVNGFGLAIPPANSVHDSLKAAVRFRESLVSFRSRLMIQIRRLLHETMPGFADLFGAEKFFSHSTGLPIAIEFPSAAAIRHSGVKGMALHMKRTRVRYQTRTLERVVAWANAAHSPSEMASMLTAQWQQLNRVRTTLDVQIRDVEAEIAGFLVKTPYVLLLSVTGINVVSAGRLAGEAGPIEYYASSRAITARAGLFPSRYQSDEVDRANGPLVRQCNRRLRAAALQMAANLIKCHPHYRGLSELWKQHKVDPRDRHCRVANRAMRMVYQIVGGRQLWRGQGVDREYVLEKLREFHRVHDSSMPRAIRDMHEAIQWMPRSAYQDEAKPLIAVAKKKQRGPEPIGDLLIPLLVELGVAIDEIVESTTSEARSSD